MKTLASQTSNIAWFKLADFVARGEKERALSVLRLLMHSVSDEALTYQLEGDILLSFNDDLALDRYRTAAHLYQKLGKFQQAISIYHRTLMLKEQEKTLQALLTIYLTTQQKIGIAHSFSKLAKLLLEKENGDYLITYTHNIAEKFDVHVKIILYAQLVATLLLYDVKNKNITNIICTTLNLFKKDVTANQSELKKFLAELKALNFQEYKKAETYLKE
ncbi:hypothetical protein A3J41_03275 [candidate division TM6 bacterium RIFCSPHIGHO2_12_FULL_38_8]|nr:MAG: hypothetical protein A3J41_03275 [candidate division TM6 bacterium RIFCSPHIGHO2_12_FULL_38_8]